MVGRGDEWGEIFSLLLLRDGGFLVVCLLDEAGKGQVSEIKDQSLGVPIHVDASGFELIVDEWIELTPMSRVARQEQLGEILLVLTQTTAYTVIYSTPTVARSSHTLVF